PGALGFVREAGHARPVFPDLAEEEGCVPARGQPHDFSLPGQVVHHPEGALADGARGTQAADLPAPAQSVASTKSRPPTKSGLSILSRIPPKRMKRPESFTPA